MNTYVYYLIKTCSFQTILTVLLIFFGCHSLSRLSEPSEVTYDLKIQFLKNELSVPIDDDLEKALLRQLYK